MFEKILALAVILASLCLAHSARAESVRPTDLQHLRSIAHRIELGLKSADQRQVCDEIGRLSGMSDELVLYRGAPNQATQEALNKLIDLNNSTTKLQSLCENGSVDARARNTFRQQTLGVLKNGVFPALDQLELKQQPSRRVSLNR